MALIGGTVLPGLLELFDAESDVLVVLALQLSVVGESLLQLAPEAGRRLSLLLQTRICVLQLHLQIIQRNAILTSLLNNIDEADQLLFID